MPTTATTYYPDSLYFDAVMQALGESETRVRVVMYLFKTSYAQRTRAHAVFDRLAEIAARGVLVEVLLNYSAHDPDVAAENYQTGIALAAAGCHVRLGPIDESLHAKMVLIDYSRLFAGSHNFTRGGLTDNKELSVYTESVTIVRGADDYIDELWELGTPIEEGAPVVPEPEPLEILLTTVGINGASVVIDFTVNHNRQVDAFAPVSAADTRLTAANMGASVPPTARQASVIPNAVAGDNVYVAIRAYRAGQEVASSVVFLTPYNPTAPPPVESYGEGESETDELPPPPLIAPHLVSVVPATETTVTLTWAFPGMADFLRFLLQQRTLDGAWDQVAIVRDPSVRIWTGTPKDMHPALPFRVVVFNLTGESAVSNQMSLEV